MTVTERPNAAEALDPRGSPLGDDAAEALIREAGRGQRRRQFRIAAALLTLVGVAGAAVAVSDGGHSGHPVAPKRAHPAPKAPTVGTKASQQANPVTPFNPHGALAGVVCQRTFCVAVGGSNEHQTGAASWSQIPAGSAIALTTVDDGVSWHTSVVPSGVTDLTSVVCPSAGNCLAVGHDVDTQTGHVVVLASTDSGATWTVQGSFAGPAAELSCVSAKQCVAVVGTAFPTMTTGILSTAGSNVFYTTDGGSTWAPAGLPALPSGQFSFLSVSCDAERFCLAGGLANTTSLSGGSSAGAILASFDGGATWQSVEDPIAQFPSAAGSLLLPLDPQATYCIAGTHCLVGGNIDGNKEGTIMTTTDGGSHWTPSTGWSHQDVPGVGSLGSPNTINCPTESYCIASSSYTMLEGTLISISTDGGNSWHPVDASMTPDHYAQTEGLASMSCIPAGPCVVVGGGLNDWLYAASSTNGGISWTASTGIPAPPGVDMTIYAPIPLKASS